MNEERRTILVIGLVVAFLLALIWGVIYLIVLFFYHH
jgi:hypothetical protein